MVEENMEYQKIEPSEETLKHMEMVKLFEVGIFLVTFVKADGSLRNMRCTRDSEHIPLDDNELTKPIVVKEGKVPRKANYSALRVYEIGVGWRSFKIETLTSAPVLDKRLNSPDSVVL